MSHWWVNIHQRFCDLEQSIKEDENTPADSIRRLHYEDSLNQRDDMLRLHRKLIGRNMLSIRSRLDLTLRDVAAQCDLAPSTIYRIEQGYGSEKGFPRYETLTKIVSAYNALGESLIVSDLLIDDYQEPEAFRSVILYPGERKILLSMQILNDRGQEVAAERVEELTKIPEYQAPGEEDVPDEG